MLLEVAQPSKKVNINTAAGKSLVQNKILSLCHTIVLHNSFLSICAMLLKFIGINKDKRSDVQTFSSYLSSKKAAFPNLRVAAEGMRQVDKGCHSAWRTLRLEPCPLYGFPQVIQKNNLTLMSTRGCFILEINKLEKNRKQTKKAPAKQRATKKAKNKQPKKAQAKQKATKKNSNKLKTCNRKNKKKTSAKQRASKKTKKLGCRLHRLKPPKRKFPW